MPISIEILQNVTQNALPIIFTCTKNIPYEFGEPHYFFSNKKSTLKFCSQFWVDSLYLIEFENINYYLSISIFNRTKWHCSGSVKLFKLLTWSCDKGIDPASEYIIDTDNDLDNMKESGAGSHSAGDLSSAMTRLQLSIIRPPC